VDISPRPSRSPLPSRMARAVALGSTSEKDALASGAPTNAGYTGLLGSRLGGMPRQANTGPFHPDRREVDDGLTTLPSIGPGEDDKVWVLDHEKNLLHVMSLSIEDPACSQIWVAHFKPGLVIFRDGRMQL
jgi:hypothetical protein